MKFNKILFSAIGLLLTAVVLRNHIGFIQYLLSDHVLGHIWWKELISNIIVNPIILLIFILCFIGLGGIFIKEPLFAIPLGMGVFNILLYVAGFLGLLTIWTLLSIVIISFSAGIYLVSFKTEEFRADLLFPRGILASIAFMFVIISAAYGFITSVSPPASWDALSYHLSVPKLYALHHGIYLIPSMIQHQSASGMEMLSSAGILLNNNVLPQLFSLLSWFLLLLLIFKLSKLYFSARTAWVSVFLFSVCPLSLYLAGIANNDMAAALLSTAAIYFLWNYLGTKKTYVLNLSAIFFGLSITAKMTGFINAILALALLSVFLIKKQMKFREALVFVLITGLFSSPLFIRNWYLTKNPVFPFLYGLLGGQGVSPDVIARIKINDEATIGVARTFINLVKLPYYMITSQERFQNQPAYFVILVFVSVLFRSSLGKALSSVEKYLLSFIMFYLFVWFINGRQLWRFLLPVLPISIALISYWFAEALPKIPRIIVGTLIVLNVIPFLGWSVNNELFAVFALGSVEKPAMSPRERYLDKALDNYEVYGYVNSSPEPMKLLLFREMRGFYLEKPYIFGDPINQSLISYNNIQTPEELKERFSQLGLTHIIINTNIYPPSPFYYDGHIISLMNGFIQKYASEEFSSRGVILYKIL
jgi:hypothetical protein